MNRETTLKLLYRFVDHSRPHMDKPFSQELKIGKYLCATDANKILLIPETEEIKIEKAENYNPPNVNGILPEFDKEPTIELDSKYIFKLFNDIPIVERYRMEECESCDGEGSFTHYRHSYACKMCDELGEVQTMHLEKVKNPNTVFRFNETDIELKNIAWLLEVFNTVLPKTLFIAKLGKAIIWFKLDETYVVFSTKIDIEEEKNKWDVVQVDLNNKNL